MANSVGEGGRNASLTGFWTGAYWYAGALPPPMAGGAPFTATLEEDGSVLSGTTTEINTFANLEEAGEELEAVLTGGRAGLDVTFTKIYLPVPGVHQTPVRYHGAVDPGFSRIEGEWRFDNPLYPTGGFRLVRLTGSLEAARLEMALVGQTKPPSRRRRKT